MIRVVPRWVCKSEPESVHDLYIIAAVRAINAQILNLKSVLPWLLPGVVFRAPFGPAQLTDVRGELG